MIETEGGHIDFAPLDGLEDKILNYLRRSFRRVSVERIACGSGLVNLYNAIASIEGKAVQHPDDKALWAAALEGSDPLAIAALDRFFLSLGAVAGDLALAHGANAVVIAGGLGYRLKDRFAISGFADRFIAKGRFERRMEAIPGQAGQPSAARPLRRRRRLREGVYNEHRCDHARSHRSSRCW